MNYTVVVKSPFFPEISFKMNTYPNRGRNGDEREESCTSVAKEILKTWSAATGMNFVYRCEPIYNEDGTYQITVESPIFNRPGVTFTWTAQK